ncbi:MAG: hypothetical protein FJ297_00190 [Planctomycetes bacterium]|nr:hypothetical protein [Planctomycetota bacterium]
MSQFKRFKNILAVVDTGFPRHPALEKASDLARRNGARLVVVDIVPDFGWSARVSRVDVDALEQALVEEKEERLEQLIAPLAREGLAVAARVLRGKSSHAILEEVERSTIDLVVRLTKGRHSRREAFLGTTSVRLLRFCPCDLWLVKPDSSDRYRRIVASIDAGTFEETHQRLNQRVLDLSVELAKSQCSALDIVYAWSIYGENVLRDRMNEQEFEDLKAATLADQYVLLDKVLDPFQMSSRSSNVHLLHGDASEQIPKFISHQGADLLVLGTIGRHGISGFFVGNTAERILDAVQCAILAIKPGA